MSTRVSPDFMPLRRTASLPVALATDDHAERGDEPGGTGKTGVIGVVIGRCELFLHAIHLDS